MTRPTALLSASLLCAAGAAALLAGCGSDDGPDPDSDLSGMVPGGTVVYVEGVARPEGELKEDADAASARVAGIGDLGDFIVGRLEAGGGGGPGLDFAADVEPWLGARAAVALPRIEDGDFPGAILVAQTTDAGAAEEFVEALPGPERDGAAVLDGTFVYAEDPQYLEDARQSAAGESLADEHRFAHSFGEATDGSLADVYVNVGAIVEQEGAEIDAGVEEALEEAGVTLREAALTASVVPRPDRIEVDLHASGIEAEKLPAGIAPELLSAMPAESFAALAFSGLGERLSEAIDRIDESGIPGQVPPGELKRGLAQAGIDVEAIAGSLGDAAAFGVGEDEPGLGGALVLTTEGEGAANALANLGALLRDGEAPGVTPLSGPVKGFAIRDPGDLGPKPLVIAGRGERIAIGYGVGPTVAVLSAGSGETLAGDPDFEDAVAALGEDPVYGYVDGPAALRLADSVVPASEQGFEEAKRFLRRIAYVVVGGSENDPTAGKLVIGLE